MSYTLTETQTVAFDQAISGEKRVIVFGGAIRGGKTYWLLITISRSISGVVNPTAIGCRAPARTTES